MDKKILKIVSTQSKYINQLPVSYGQLIFVSDTRELYFDHKDKGRIPYVSGQQIIVLDAEIQRSSLQHPIESFYFVIETKVLWRCSSSGVWTKLYEPQQKQIIFSSIHDFPEIGSEEVLYIDGKVIYRWIGDDNGGHYEPILDPNNITARIQWDEL